MKRTLLAGCLLFTTQVWAEDSAPAEPRAIPMDQLGVEAQKQYKGGGLSVKSTGRTV